jgi:hypothetical protein
VTEAGDLASWLARCEWPERRISDRGRAGTGVLIGLALFWNSIAWTVALMVFRTGSEAPVPARYAVLISPVAGLFLAAAALRAVWQQIRYDASILELATLPGAPGRLLAGVVETRGVIAPVAGFPVRHSCLRRRVRGSGQGRSTSEEVLWPDEQVLPGASHRGGGIGIPFAIPLPAWGLVFFTLLWTATIMAMFRLGAPALRVLVFGLFDVVLLLSIGQLFLLRMAVRAEAGELGKTILGRTIPTRREAEWLAAEPRTTLAPAA